MSRILAGIGLLVVYLTLTATMLWLISGDDTRSHYLARLGLSDPPPKDGEDDVAAPGPVTKTEPAAPTPRPHRAAARPRPEDSPQGADNACKHSGTANPINRTPHDIYRWTDENGRVVFSDFHPPGASAKRIGSTVEQGVVMFSSEYQFVGETRDPSLERRVTTDINGVFRFLSQHLRLTETDPLHVRLTIIDGQEAFTRYRRDKAPELNTYSGFYLFADNEAVVRLRGPAATLAVVRHEIAHLALGNWLGSTPVWLCEGLAELAERTAFRQSHVLIQVSKRNIERLRAARRAGKLPPLAEFLEMSRNDWERIGLDLSYAYAWSLAHFLVQDRNRLRILSDYLNALANNKCHPVDYTAYLASTYPGGIQAMESAWTQWLMRDEARLITF